MMAFDSEKKFETAEKIILTLFFLAAVYVRLVQPFGGALSHNYPVFYSANDAFQGSALAEYTKISGTPLYSPTYMSTGFPETINISPPLTFILPAMFSIVSGINMYDAIHILIVLFSTIAAIVMYMIIRRRSINLAILSIPFMLGVFNFAFELIYPFGLWNFIFGSFFALGALWAFDSLEMKHSAVLLGLLLAASALAHAVQTFFITGLIAGYLVLQFISKKLEKGTLIKIAGAYAILIALSAYYLNIMKLYFRYKGMQLFTVSTDFSMAPGKGVSLGNFEYTALLLILGIALFAISIATRNKKDSSLLEFLEINAKNPFVMFVSVYFLLIGYTNYIGFSERAWQIRTFWPVYLSPLFALGLLFLLKKAKRNISKIQIAVVGAILVVFFFSVHLGRLSPQGVMDEGTWNGIMWIRNNTLTNERVFYFYTPLLFTKQSLYHTERLSYAVDFEDFVDGIKNQKLKPEYKYELASEYENGIHRTGWFSFEEQPKSALQPVERPGYLNMNYYIFTISALGDQPVLIQYNLAIRDEFLRNNMTEVYNNGRISILKNHETQLQNM